MSRKRTIEQYKQEVFEQVGDEYTILGKEYKDNKTKIMTRHNSCGHEWNISPDKFLNRKNRCPKCFGKNKKTTKQFIEEVDKLTNGKFKVIGEYINAKTPVLIKHLTCNSDWLVTPDKFLCLKNKDKCPCCNEFSSKVKTNIIKTNRLKLRLQYKDLFSERVNSLVGKEYTIIGEYINANTPILMRHNICGTEYPVTPNKFLHNRRCPHCKRSIGEEKIHSILIELNIIFQEQYRIKDCKRKRTLPFDFGMFVNGKLVFIEYQGGLHYISKKRFGGDEKLKYRQENDEIKREYCKRNNIPLLEIPYWEFDDIEVILNSFIKELSENDSSISINKEGEK